METITNLLPGRTVHGLVLRSDPARAIWPNPQDSVGPLIGRVGRKNCWEATGPVRQTFLALSKDIKEYLEAHTEAISNWVTWSIYMIGRHAISSVPTIIFCCEDERHRKAIRDQVRTSGILDHYPPGIDLKHLPRAPNYKQLVQLASRAEVGTMDSWSPSSTMLSSSGPHPEPYPESWLAYELLSRAPKVYCSTLRPESGATLYIEIEGRQDLRISTAGPELHVDGHVLLLTASHVFSEDQVEPSEVSQDDSALQFSDSDCESELASQDLAESQSKSTPPEHAIDPGDLDKETDVRKHLRGRSEDEVTALPSLVKGMEPSSTADDNLWTLSNLVCIGRLLFPMDTGQKPRLDYALVHVTSRYDAKDEWADGTWTNRDKEIECTVEDFDFQRPLIAQMTLFTASSGPVHGVVSPTPVFLRLPGEVHNQQVYTVTLDVALQKGDCGSAAFSRHYKRIFLGHVVAGSADSKIAFLVPASMIFHDVDENIDDIKRRLRIKEEAVHHTAFETAPKPNVSSYLNRQRLRFRNRRSYF